jgi:chromosome segregation ATPase
VEHEVSEKELSGKYAELEDRHREVLDLVEELRTEVSKARAAEASAASSPRSGQPVIRRKSSQNVMIIDRAHRSFASLRNIATENFEDKPDVMQNFELNINSAMHELHVRSERIQELEADIAAARKEMESKMTMIAGLTRERSSIKAASPVDMTIVSGLRQQLEMSEMALHRMREAHEAKEQELTTELESLRDALRDSPRSDGADKADVSDLASQQENIATKEKHIAELEQEVSSWEAKHQTALDNLQAAESAAKTQMEQLESELESLNAVLAETHRTRASGGATPDSAADATTTKQENLINYLRNEIDEYKAIIDSNATRIAELEQKHQMSQSAMEAANKDRDIAVTASESHLELICRLEDQLEALEQARKSHDENMELLRAAHKDEVDQIKTAEQREYGQQMEVLLTEHSDAVAKLECDLSAAREDLMKVATQVAFALGLEVSVDKITERIDDLIAGQSGLSEEQDRRGALEKEVTELTRANDEFVRDLDIVRQVLAEVLHLEPDSDRALAPVNEHLQTLRSRMLDLKDENNRNSRIVQQLEEQLASNFDEAQATSNRLSTLAERNAKLEEVSAAKARIQGELDTIREEYAALQTRYNEVSAQASVQRSDSVTAPMNPAGPLRKSSSVTSLPSPPPSVPLPPLPGISTTAGGPPPSQPTSPTHGHRPSSKDQIALAQIQEDQEARIVSIEKSLKAEKTLNTVLEESLNDLERTSNKLKQDCDGWRQRAQELDAEIKILRERAAQQPQQDENNRQSLLAERKRREDAEAARRHTEERMQALSQKKKKKASLNCF